MSHVDEGALHAYLDGALDEYPTVEADAVRHHLDVCADCAARLEEVRLLRFRADEILGLATPRVAAPSFEELRAYVRATRPPASPASARLNRLGWAASVLVALGVGWMVRDGQLDRALVPTDGLIVPVQPATEGASTATPPVNADAAGDGGAETVDVGGPEVVPVAGEEREDVDGTDVSSTPTVGAAGVAADGGTTPEEPVEGTTVAEGAAAQDEATSTVVVTDAAISSPADAGASESGELDVPAVTAASVARAELPLTGTTTTVRLPSLDDPNRERFAGGGIVSSRLETRAVRPIGGRGGRVEEVRLDGSGEPSLVVPGVDVVLYENLGEGTTPLGVHIVQQLDDGLRLDIYHLPEGVDPSVLPPLGSDRNEVRGDRDGEWVILRAYLPSDRLVGLLARLNPDG